MCGITRRREGEAAGESLHLWISSPRGMRTWRDIAIDQRLLGLYKTRAIWGRLRIEDHEGGQKGPIVSSRVLDVWEPEQTAYRGALLVCMDN